MNLEMCEDRGRACKFSVIARSRDTVIPMYLLEKYLDYDGTSL